MSEPRAHGPAGGAERRGRLGDVGAIAALTVGLAVFWVRRMGAPGAPYVPGVGDVFGYFLAAYGYQADRFAQGSFPFWNPYQGAGVPFLGVLQPGALYPPRVLLCWLSPAEAMSWSTFGHVLLMLLGMYALCRRLGTGACAAMLAGVIVTTAYALPWVHATPLLEPGAWLPILALAVVAILRDGGWGWVLVLGAGTAMPPLAGGYQVTLYTIYALAIVALAVVLENRRHGIPLRPRHVGRLLVAAALAIATAAPQVLPTLAWSGETMRQTTGLTDAQMMPMFSEGPRWMRIVTYFFRQTSADVCYLSVPVVLFGVAAAVVARPMGTVFALAALLTGLFTIASERSVFFAIYKVLPGLSMFRFPSRIMLLTAFFAALAAALGVHALAGLRPPAAPRRRLVLEASALAVGIVLLVLPYRNTLAVVWTAGPELTAPDERFFPPSVRPSSAYRVSVPGGRLDLRVGAFVRQGMRQQVRVLQDYEPLSSARLGTFLSVVTGMPPPDPSDFHLFTGSLLDDPFMTRPDLLDLVSVQGILVRADGVPFVGVKGWTRLERSADLITFRNDRALPRAYLVARARFVADEAAALDTITAEDFDGHAEAVVVGTPATDADRALAAAAPAPATTATFTRDDPEHLTIDVAPAEPSLLVVADAFAPGWEATVDGRPRRIWQTNYLVRGVTVGPGDRVVELRYRAPGFAAGVVSCVATWSVVLVALAWRRAA